MTTLEKVSVWTTIALILALIPSTHWIREHAPGWAFKCTAGFYFGTMAAFASVAISDLIMRFRANGFAALDRDAWVRPFALVHYAIIAFLGVTAWYLGWNGKTGIAYGVGATIGAMLIGTGAGSVIKRASDSAKENPSDKAYAAIGRAVIAMQMFEVAFVSIHEGLKMITDPDYLQKTGGMIDKQRYRTATKSVVNMLSARGQIAPDLEDRLNTLIDCRHELMHRWFLRHGWPGQDNNDPVSYIDVIQRAHWVRTEADAITLMLANYMLIYATDDQHTEDRDAVKKAITDIFHQAQVPY